MPKPTPEMQQCIEECQNCHRVCLTTAANHCLEAGGKHVEPVHYRTMLDCAEICETSANFMMRSSTLHTHVCRACAEVCEECARSCEEVGDMPECVEACRRCAESCRKMAQK
ncbi:MAG: four-helix bundle copper-binding protein [Armatimonadaceae bacterium]